MRTYIDSLVYRPDWNKLLKGSIYTRIDVALLSIGMQLDEKLDTSWGSLFKIEYCWTRLRNVEKILDDKLLILEYSCKRTTWRTVYFWYSFNEVWNPYNFFYNNKIILFGHWASKGSIIEKKINRDITIRQNILSQVSNSSRFWLESDRFLKSTKKNAVKIYNWANLWIWCRRIPSLQDLSRPRTWTVVNNGLKSVLMTQRLKLGVVVREMDQ